MEVRLSVRTSNTVREYFEKAQNPLITTVLPQKAKTIEEALEDFEKTLLPDTASFGKTILADERYIGDVWCYCIDPDDEPNVMLSFCIFDPNCWKQGIGTEAVRLFLAEVREKYNLKSIGAFTFSDNMASVRVLEKNGFRLRKEFVEDGRASKYFQYKYGEPVLTKQLAKKAIAFIGELFRGNSGGHDAEHSIRVYRNAMLICDSEPGCSRDIAALSALLHDADDHKLFSTENNENAKRFLIENRVPDELAERICETINAVSFSQNQGRKPDTIEGKIVQDADRLDAIGAIGIARTFAYGGEHGRSMGESVQHFHDKLLRLKDLMNTPTGKALAEERHAFLEIYLQELAKELD